MPRKRKFANSCKPSRPINHVKLYVIPFGEIQRDIVANAPAPFRVVLYRRVMIRIAQELARREQCWELVTGDSLGQVASRTPKNSTIIEEAAELPLLRPLIGMDKVEITDQAQRSAPWPYRSSPIKTAVTLRAAAPRTKTDSTTFRRSNGCWILARW